MRRLSLALLFLSLFSAGCHSTGCCWFQKCHDPNDADDDCYCCTDGSESHRYRPPGPWWTRPDCGCPKKCRRYQLWRSGVCQEAKETVNYTYTELPCDDDPQMEWVNQ
ncbi:MAG: hypothetical protein ACKV0T_29025 [Planctomycetales bacterium]